MRKNIAVSIIAFLISFICLLGLIYTPQTIKEYVPNDKDIVTELTAANVSFTNSVEVAATGEYTIIDADPYVIFNVAAADIKTIVLKVTEMEASVPVYLYVDDGSGYYEERKYVSVVVPGSQYAYFEIEEQNIASLRIDIDTNVCIEKLELHSEKASFKETKYELDIALLVFDIVFSIVIAVAAFFVNKAWNIMDKVFDFFARNKKGLLKGTVALGAVGIAAIPCEFIIARYILNMFSRGTAFNWNRYLFIICFLYVIVFMILMKEQIAKRLETVVLGLILIIGTTMVITQPMAHSGWDIDNHYRMAHNSSYLDEAYVTQADASFFSAAYESLAKPNGVANLGNIRYMEMAYEYVLEVKDTQISLPHLPSGIAMGVVRLLGGSFQAIFLAGEYINLLIYAFLTYFAIKKLKSGKLIMAVFALFPTNLVIATNYSYDYWITGFAMLGTAYFIGECQDRSHQISVKDTIIMCGSLALACLPKQIYVPIMLLPFLMPKDKIKNKKLYYLICIASFSVLFTSLFSRATEEAAAGGDNRGGSDVSVTGQLYYILHNPGSFWLTLVTQLRAYLSLGWMYQAITNYANLGVTTWGSNIFIVVLLFVIMTDKNDYDKGANTWLIKSYSYALYFGMAVLVSVAFYLVFTPVGADYVGGCQARYMFPVMPVFFLLAAPHSTRINMDIKKYRYVVLGIILFITLMDNFIFTIGRML